MGLGLASGWLRVVTGSGFMSCKNGAYSGWWT